MEAEHAFKTLVAFRRQLANGYKQLTRTRTHAVQAYMFCRRGPVYVSLHQMRLERCEASMGANDRRDQTTADINKLPEQFAELDSRLSKVIDAVNDEIPIVIGYVQVEDAKKSRELTGLTVKLTESTMQQAKWTVVLAFLAAFYLPMTLVTAIFGMNIKEISDSNTPNRFWVAGTWALTFVITASCVSGYALWSSWQAYKKEKIKNKEKATFKSAVKESLEAVRKSRYRRSVEEIGVVSDIEASM